MTTSSEPQAKKTRDLPNLSECHCCHLRVDLAKAKNKLHILYSEWRIVLLCNKCLARVESTELCSYCFNDSSSDDCFSCHQCKRRVHRHCDSEYRSVALWSRSSLAVEVSVCADCWVPESLARWRSVVRSRKKTTRRNRVGLELGRSRVSGVEIEGKWDAFGAEKGSGDADCDVDGDPKSSVCVCDSSTEVGRLKLEPRLDLEEEEEEEDDDDDDDGPFKEGEGSCSNGVDLESPPSYKQEDCNCITRQEGQKCNAKLDPYYFKYRRRSTIDHSLLKYKRRITIDCGKSLSTIEFPMLTYKRRSTDDCCMLTYKRRSTVNRFMLTYKRRSIFDHSMFTYKRRRPEILTACSKIQGLEG